MCCAIKFCFLLTLKWDWLARAVVPDAISAESACFKLKKWQMQQEPPLVKHYNMNYTECLPTL